MKPINSLPPFKRFCVTIGNLPSSYVDSMSYYECIMWLCKYLKDTVIPAVNENAEAVNELINWFNNLDVQDEINNKLDEMAESGELEEIISEYLNTKSLLIFDTVSDMKSSVNLIEGSYTKTLGYHSIGDGGSATYKVMKVTTDDDVNEMDKVKITEELYAQIILENTEVIVNQFGAYGDSSHDDTNVIQYAIDYAKPKKLAVKFLNQIYVTSEPLELYECTKLVGQYVNDEYKQNATILNSTSDMITLSDNTIGIHIDNLLFQGDETADIYFFHGANNKSLEWCEFNNVSFRNYKNVFDCFMLGCRLNNIFINHVASVGSLHGSDNTFTDWFIGTPFATESYNGLNLTMSLSRFTNLYFTGKTTALNGCDSILSIGGYSSNLEFDGCYFDYSNGSAVKILGQGNNFPKSGATGISFNTCLFRGNCCSSEVKHVIDVNYARSVSFNNCSFKENELFTTNANSKTMIVGQFAQNISLFNNYYEVPLTFYENTYQLNVQIVDPLTNNYNKLGYSYNNGHNFQALGKTKVIQFIEDTYQTDATYGAITINFARTYTNKPIVIPVVNNGVYTACVNSVTTSSCQLIIRQVSNGNPVLNSNVEVGVLVATLSGSE